MIEVPEYEVMLYLNGKLIGNCRTLCRNLKWVRRRTRAGVDEISFTLNDALFSKWCSDRGVKAVDMLKPLALECRVIRNGVPVVGGFLATMPAYRPNEVSAELAMRFDGFLNLLDGVYLAPAAAVSGKMGELIHEWINEANSRSEAAGKGYGFMAGQISEMAVVQQSFENYTSIKHVIVNRCDNTSGAGPFDVYFHADKTYDVVKDEEFGDDIKDYIIKYPAPLAGVSALNITAAEVSGFASAVIGIGAGEVGASEEASEAIVNMQTNSEAVKEFGYFETMYQASSVSVMETLERNTAAKLKTTSSGVWQPQVTLTGRQVAPTPSGKNKIWVGDTVQIYNSIDYTGQTNGKFRVNELSVSVSASNAETIKPTLVRGDVSPALSFAQEIMAIKDELLALKTARNN